MPSKVRIEPPPAATVSTSSMGLRILAPATLAVSRRSSWPANRQTSVEVPPMSKPSTAAAPACSAVLATPTTPPAGPETTASRPRKASARTRPPAEVMKNSGAPSTAFATRWT